MTEENSMPAKVQAATQFIEWMGRMTDPDPEDGYPPVRPGRKASKLELEVLSSAHGVLLRYFESQDAWGPSAAPPTVTPASALLPETDDAHL